MKEKYTKPAFEVTYFKSEDIITDSGLTISPDDLTDNLMGEYSGEI